MNVLEQAKLITPDYAGNTIGNVPGTVAALLGVESPGLAPLRGPLWQPLLQGDEVRRVVLILVDGMGQNLVQACAEDTAWLREGADIADCITSVFPSTTVNALSSLWTGAGPAQHGLVGLELLFPRLGVMGQMLSLSPSFAWLPDALVRAGVDPYSYLPVPGIAQTLQQAGIETYSLKHYSLLNSSLSKMFSRGITEEIGTVTAADLLWQVKALLERATGPRMYISVYWAAVDTLSHRHGFDHPAVAAELRSFLHLLRTELFLKLSPAARRGTVVVLTADHGQTITPLEQRIYLEDHPQLQRMLLMRAAGEPRTAYLYARAGEKQGIIDYIDEYLSHAAIALGSQEALALGLFGPPPYAEELAVRVGDVMVTMREGYSFLSKDGDEFLANFVGRHGGLTPAEMEVPFFVFRLS